MLNLPIVSNLASIFPLFGILSAWSCFAIVLLIILIIFWMQYRKRQM
jgi:hypothetical protein